MGSNSGSLLVSCVTATDRVAMYQISPKFGSLNTTITVLSPSLGGAGIWERHD